MSKQRTKRPDEVTKEMSTDGEETLGLSPEELQHKEEPKKGDLV